MFDQRSRDSGFGRISVSILAIALVWIPGKVWAEPESVTLSLGSGVIQFPDADPRFTPSIAASQNPVSISVEHTGPGNWVLTVLADGDLSSGSDTIPISNMRWTATGSAFLSGTLSKNSAQAVGSGTLSAAGSLSFYLKNFGTYSTGAYAQSFTFTVTSF